MKADDGEAMESMIAHIEAVASPNDGNLGPRESSVSSVEPLWGTAGYAQWSDHELMAAVREGDERAFDELVRRYQAPMTGYLYRMLNDYEMALDLAQETFVRLYQNAHRYRANHSFSTYLYRIATNLAISELRRRKRWNMLSLVSFFTAKDGDEEDRAFDLPDPRPLPEAWILREEERQIVARAVASLPEKYRAAIVLRDIQGLDYEQIAEILGVPLGTVKSRINRARSFLREKLRGYLSE
jgi:RNA polymerase sigma-70 factor (ECF subfamily)